MGDIHPAERYPAWMLRTLFLTAVALIFGAILLLAGRAGIPHSGVLATHCLVNAFVLLAAWNGYRDEIVGSSFVQLVVKMTAFGLGMVDLFLAAAAAIHLRPHNAVLLVLIVPAVAGWIAWTLDYRRKKTTEETVAADEAVLAKVDEGDDLPAGLKLRVGAHVMLFFAAYMGLVLSGLWLCVMWGEIVWRAVNDGTAYGFMDVINLFWLAIRSKLWRIVVSVAFVIGAVVLIFIAEFLRGSIKRFWTRGKSLSPELEARVEASVRAVWDFANRPERKSRIIPVYIVPVLLFLGWIGAMIVYAAGEEHFALRLFEARHGVPGSWFFFYAAGGGIGFVMVAAALLLWSFWHVAVDLWPGAAEAVVTQRYRRNMRDVGSSVAALRGRLTRYFKKGGDAPFDPRAYLLARRLRFGKWIYGITAVVVPVAMLGIWTALGGYTVFTPTGIEQVRRLTTARTNLAYADIRSVEIGCTFDSHGWAKVSWLVRAGDGRSANLINADALASRLPGLLKVDAILRRQGTHFSTRVAATGESRSSDACLEKAGTDLRDFRGFLHVMHQD